MPSELRRDPLSHRAVIIAAERAKRPSDFQAEAELSLPTFDPFGPGNEDKTTPEICAYRDPNTAANSPGWRVRVVPNKYPALQIEGALNKRGDGIYDRMQGIGAHEIIIDTPECVRSFTSQSDAHVQEVLWMYRDRLMDLSRDKRLKYGIIFKNVGKLAGASLYHSHSQLIATPVVPHNITEKIDICQKYYQSHERCLLCDMVTQEVEQKARVVSEGGFFVAFEPFAPRTPFETWILPKNHEHRFEDLQAPACEELAYTLKRTLLRIEKGLGGVSYNYMLCTAPFDSGPMPHFHWHLEIVPRITSMAGFEWGTGFHINPVPPEEAADFLRSVKI